MDKDKAIKWSAALRSGKYTQGEGSLNADGKFCCLGVLCEVAIEDGLDLNKRRFEVNDDSFAYGEGEMTGSLPREVSDWANLSGGGLPAVPGAVVDNPDKFTQECMYGTGALAFHTMNDSLGWNFNQIADIIDRAFVDAR